MSEGKSKHEQNAERLAEGQQRIGTLTAGFMEAIEEYFAEVEKEGRGAEIGTIAIIVEVNAEDLPNAPGWSHVVFRTNDPRPWVQHGLFLAASRASLGSNQ